MTHRSRRLLTTAAAAAVVTGVSIAVVHGVANANTQHTTTPPSSTVVQGSSAALAPDAAPSTPGGDYYTVTGPAQRTHTPPKAGLVEYCPLDQLRRPTCAYGELTSSQRQQAEAAGRQPITVNPPGWAHNRTVTIPALQGVTGSKTYRGFFWNRSHLVADSLGGAATAQNLVTGTRTQNVGSTQADGQYAGGMAFTEAQARKYLTTHNGDACPLYYAATPVYTGIELIPRTVTVDIQACDRTIDEHVEVANTAAGWTIDYSTGAFTAGSAK
jgi:DNA-entry nuclease